MAKFYCRFIETFNHVAVSLIDILKDGKKSKFKKMKFEITSEAIQSFEELKRYFQTAPILIYFDLTKYSMLETNAFGKAPRAIFW